MREVFAASAASAQLGHRLFQQRAHVIGLAGGLGFAVSFLVACGGGANLLTGGESSNLNSQLDAVSSAVDAHNCGAADSAAASFGHAVANLPSTINTTLAANLDQGASTLANLTAKDCRTTSTATTTTSWGSRRRTRS